MADEATIHEGLATIEFVLLDYSALLKDAERLDSTVKSRRWKELQRLGLQIQQVEKVCRIEIKELPKGKKRTTLESDLEIKMGRYRELNNDMEYAKATAALNLRQPDANDNDIKAHLEKTAAREQLAALGDATQDLTQESLDRIKNMTDDTEAIAGAVNEKLDEHTEQLHRINEKLSDVEHNVQRAKATMRSILKSASGDRFTQILCFLFIILLIIAIVLFSIPAPQ